MNITKKNMYISLALSLVFSILADKMLAKLKFILVLYINIDKFIFLLSLYLSLSLSCSFFLLSSIEISVA